MLKSCRWVVLILACAAASLAHSAPAAEPGHLQVDAAKPTAKIGPMFYGLMTEEINHAYDGGLYAELIQNRIFQDDPGQPVHWQLVQDGSAIGTMTLDETDQAKQTVLTRSLRLDIPSIAPGERVGIANAGFWGIPVWPNTSYRASFYARAASGFNGPLTITIESNDGKTVFASGTVSAVGSTWKKYELTLKTSAVTTSTANRFVISASGKGSIWFSLVSLFPPTYHDRPNGLRIDLMQKLAALNPKFLRFPGGNYLEGNEIDERFQWEKTIGPLEQRPGHQCPWGYRSSDGLGLLEFLYWCEDLNMQPILAVYAGYSLRGSHIEPGPGLQPFVQEALDEIEYCIGDTTTKWGARRAGDGHPEPFKIQYIEVGNEDWFDRSGSYDARFAQFYDAIKQKYPHLQLISTTPVHTRKADLVDDHGYPNVSRMLSQTRRYKARDPKLPKVFFGEWATKEGRPTPTVRAAIADAAWMIGLQQDAETVLMNCYAPLFVNVNRGASQWSTNLIGYDAAQSFGSASYYAQALLTNNLGDENLATQLTVPFVATKPQPPQGAIGVGTWNTAAQFKDIKVTAPDGNTLFSSDFSRNLDKWKAHGGKWGAREGAAEQSDLRHDDIYLTAGDKQWTDYTLTLKARKTDGREGFLILFHVKDDNNLLWLNVGGWRNTRTALQQAAGGGDKSDLGTSSNFTVETGRWYDVKIEVHGSDVKCSIDGNLVCTGRETPGKPVERIYAAASRDQATGDVILKVANAGSTPQPLHIDITGAGTLAKSADLWQLTGSPDDMNTAEAPTKIIPQHSELPDAGNTFSQEFPQGSLSVIRLKSSQ